MTILPLLHTWPDRYAVLAYTTTGRFGDTAIVGYVPHPAVPDPALMATAARHQPSRLYGSAGGGGFADACWLICVGWSARTVPKPGNLELDDAAWSLEPDGSTELVRTMYGHDRLCVGRFTLEDPQQLRRAADVLPAPAYPPTAVR
ncbi:hypothetical protein GCM10009654_27130 [Streptomyces hebeiensis]|uniref:Uncharacterized protein n=1 Tax=Streptomyces hebeiensis TaxID=229486 RepID=A0ABN1UUW4_9ACTN